MRMTNPVGSWWVCRTISLAPGGGHMPEPLWEAERWFLESEAPHKPCNPLLSSKRKHNMYGRRISPGTALAGAWSWPSWPPELWEAPIVGVTWSRNFAAAALAGRAAASGTRYYSKKPRSSSHRSSGLRRG